MSSYKFAAPVGRWVSILVFVGSVSACTTSTPHGSAPAKAEPPAPSEIAAVLKMTMPVANGVPSLAFDSEWDRPELLLFKSSDALHVTVSAQPSEAALIHFLRANTGSSPITVVDVRQESHGFVNGTPITWASERNWGNAGRGHDDALAEEDRLLTELKNQGTVDKPVFPVVKPGERTSRRVTLEKTKIKSVSTEQFLVESQNARYVRLTITEAVRPTNEETDRLIEAFRILPEAGWIHVHDRMENTRANTVVAMIDMLKNAKQVSEEQIITRENAFLLDQTWSDPLRGPDWSRVYAQERRLFLNVFYRYAQANPMGQPLQWTEWLTQHAPH